MNVFFRFNSIYMKMIFDYDGFKKGKNYTNKNADEQSEL